MALDTGNTKSALSTLISGGADAMSNLYYVAFEGVEENGSGIEGALKDSYLTIRTNDFKLPKFELENHTVNFMTSSLDLPKPSYSGEKTFELTFRVDKYFAVYKQLKWLESNNFRADCGYASTEIPNLLNISVYTFNTTPSESDVTSSIDAFIPESSKKKMYTFKNCWIKAITGVSFTYDNADPVTATATFAFTDWEEF